MAVIYSAIYLCFVTDVENAEKKAKCMKKICDTERRVCTSEDLNCIHSEQESKEKPTDALKLITHPRAVQYVPNNFLLTLL